MAGMPWRAGMATHCRRCFASDLEYFEDGTARCRSCGTLSPPAWVPAPTVASPPAASPPPGAPPSAPGAPSASGPPPGFAPYSPARPAPYRTANFSSIFSDTFGVFARHPLEFFLPYFVFSIAVSSLTTLAAEYTVGSLPLTFDPSDPSTFPLDALLAYLGFVMIIALGAYLVGTVVQGGVSHFAILRHRSSVATLGGSFRESLSRILSLLGAGILFALVVLALFAIPVALILLGLLAFNAALLGIGVLSLLVAVPLGIFIGIALSLFVPAIMMERVRAVDSLRRSWTLTKGRRLSLFGAYLVIGLLGGVVSLAITLAAALIGDPIVGIVLGAVAQGLVGSWAVIAAAIGYDLIVSQPAYPAWPWPAWPPAGVPPGPPSPPPAGPPGP